MKGPTPLVAIVGAIVAVIALTAIAAGKASELDQANATIQTMNATITAQKTTVAGYYSFENYYCLDKPLEGELIGIESHTEIGENQTVTTTIRCMTEKRDLLYQRIFNPYENSSIDISLGSRKHNPNPSIPSVDGMGPIDPRA